MRAVLAAMGALALLAAAGPARAAEPRPPTPHREGELECRNCHFGKHQGIVQMYVGLGGRGTPMIPSHMFQVRVECIACHTTPTTEPRTAEVVGQTMRPSEQACLRCHGSKYQGMLQQWTTTLAAMRRIVDAKLVATRAAVEASDAPAARLAPARKRLDDAEFNARFVERARGVHNVFYAADLLTLANGWLDEATALAGKPPAKVDDQLVRGGYCAVLCHAAAGVKQQPAVVFAGQRVPHVRHVAEFGATCTSCHSPERHKAVTATRATCAACHHSPQNERCESCHRGPSEFYRGRVTSELAEIKPNSMAETVGCTGCHDWSQKPSRKAIAARCTSCHDAGYLARLEEWTTQARADVGRTVQAVSAADAALARARRAGRAPVDAVALLGEARGALALVRRGGAAHNPDATHALLSAAREKAAQATASAQR